MPAGVSWGRYLSFLGAALMSMFAGSTVVHTYYRPLDDLDKYIAKEIEEKHVNISVEEILHTNHDNFSKSNES